MSQNAFSAKELMPKTACMNLISKLIKWLCNKLILSYVTLHRLFVSYCLCVHVQPHPKCGSYTLVYNALETAHLTGVVV